MVINVLVVRRIPLEEKQGVWGFERQHLQWWKLQQRFSEGTFPWQWILIALQDCDQQESPFPVEEERPRMWSKAYGTLKLNQLFQSVLDSHHMQPCLELWHCDPLIWGNEPPYTNTMHHEELHAQAQSD